MLARRAIKTRQSRWVQYFAAKLIAQGIKPNFVSLLSMVFAAIAGGCLLAGSAAACPKVYFLIAGEPVLAPAASCPTMYFLIAALCIQLRLLCNMMDGVLAVEGKLSTNLGDLFNELPDRISDSIILVCAGYAIAGHPFGVMLGWAAALLAVMTAYIRLLGTSLGTKAYFSGPMAKPHRMFTMTVACIAGQDFIFPGLILIVLGSLITCVRRTNFIVREMTA